MGDEALLLEYELVLAGLEGGASPPPLGFAGSHGPKAAEEPRMAPAALMFMD